MTTTEVQQAETSTWSNAKMMLALLRPLLIKLAVVYVAAGLLLVIVHNMRRGNLTDRVANPGDGGTRPVAEPLFGFDHWTTVYDVGTLIAMLLLVTAFVVGWKFLPGHPVLLMTLATTGIVWMDPAWNWAPYAVYNPQLWHYPESWAWVSLSPTVEPWVVIGYTMFYFAPYFPAIRILRRLQARRGPGAFVSRHPLISLGLLAFAIGFVFDAFLEVFLIRTHMYVYSQVIPFGSIFTGTTYQFPLLIESTAVTLVMIPAAVLLYRDDTGRTQAEKLAQRVRVLRGRPILGTFLVMFAFLNVAYFAYGAVFTAVRASKLATSVACPYPFPDAKVYDPQGFYEKEGQPGPYFPGILDGWPSGQSERPDVTAPADGGRCGGGDG